MRKLIFFAAFISAVGLSTAYSPAQIVEVTDNFGNTFDVDSNYGHDGTFARIVNEEQEVIVSEDTEITFCVTEVAHEEGRDLEFYFSHWGPQKSTGWQDDNCATFSGYTEEDWSGNTWRFEIYARDDSGNSARNAELEGGYDFQFQPRYSNLVLPSSSEKETVTSSYDTIEVSKPKYEEFKQDSEQLTEVEENLESKNETIEELRENLDQRNSEINELNEEVNEKDSTIQDLNNQVNEMNSTINELKNRIEEINDGLLDKLASLF